MPKINVDPFLIKLAHITRKQLEIFAKKHRSIGDPDDLGGFCAIASYLFKEIANEFNYKLVFVRGEYWGGDHCWNEYKNWIIDLTATQFMCNRRVRIVSVRHKNYVKLESKFNAPVFDTWGDQNPNLHIEQFNDLINNIKFELQKKKR